jgi:hypothetical protein
MDIKLIWPLFDFGLPALLQKSHGAGKTQGKRHLLWEIPVLGYL